MKVVILTGCETRHSYFRKRLASDDRLTVLATFCEGQEKSLENRTAANADSSQLERQHVQARTQAEADFFRDSIDNITDKSQPQFIPKGDINRDNVVSQIIDLNPDVLVCYGSSLVKSQLLEVFKGRFLNVHLGLSPYYRGSGTNVMPLINNEPDMVGATFMYIDAGIDTGHIIHQIRADVCLGDSPHSIGNRLIRKMAETYIEIIVNFKDLATEEQPSAIGKLYYQKDFDAAACRKLYDNFADGMIEDYLNNEKDLPYIVTNKGLLK